MAEIIRGDGYRIVVADALRVLRSMRPDSVHAVVTSPPYWGIRAYDIPPSRFSDGWVGCLGEEESPDEYVPHLVELFREVRRVLRPDGTCWMNMGDTYSKGARNIGGIRRKQRLLMPARCALALADDGWWVRSEIIWYKNPMPASVPDRPTDAHEMVYQFTKAPEYFYDLDAVRVPSRKDPDGTRNLWTVWEISTQRSPGLHFSTFPEKLVEPCIKASTSQHGVCAKCGAPYERIVERDLSECETAMSEVRDIKNPDEIARYLKRARVAAGLTCKQVDEALGTVTLYSWYEGRPAGIQTPTPERWEELREIIGFGHEHDEDVRRTKWVEVTVQPDAYSIESTTRRQTSQMPKRITKGWRPTCDHKRGGVKPATVLDPFCGSGTTGVVALRLGRKFIGIELSNKSGALADTRIGSSRRIEAARSVLERDGNGWRFNGRDGLTRQEVVDALAERGLKGRDADKVFNGKRDPMEFD